MLRRCQRTKVPTCLAVFVAVWWMLARLLVPAVPVTLLRVEVNGVAVAWGVEHRAGSLVPLEPLARLLGIYLSWDPVNNWYMLNDRRLPLFAIGQTNYCPADPLAAAARANLERRGRTIAFSLPGWEWERPSVGLPRRLVIDGIDLVPCWVAGNDQILVPVQPLALALGLGTPGYSYNRRLLLGDRELPLLACGEWLVAPLDALAPPGATITAEPDRVSVALSTPANPVSPRTVASGPLVNAVALTFDDALVSGSTRLVEILEAKKAPATFFITGDPGPLTPLVHRILCLGGEMGSHGYTHRPLPQLTIEEATAELVASRLALGTAAGQPPRFFRPPLRALDPALVEIAAQAGMITILWSVSADDVSEQATAASVERAVLSQAHPGAIIVLHSAPEATIDALPAIIDGLRARGLEPVSLSELLGP